MEWKIKYNYEDALKVVKGRSKSTFELSDLSKKILENISIREHITQKDLMDHIIKDFFEYHYKDYESLYRDIILKRKFGDV